MRLKHTFEMIDLDDQTIAVPVGANANEFHGVIKLNGTAAAIFKLLNQDTTEETIVDAMMQEYKISRDVLSRDVSKYIQEFQEKGLLIE